MEQIYALDLLVFGIDDGAMSAQSETQDHEWWIVYDEEWEPIAYSGMSIHDDIAYYARVGVLHRARGNGLQKKLSRKMESYARKQGCIYMYTYVAVHNPISANNLIALGYRAYEPEVKWAGEEYLYVSKKL